MEVGFINNGRVGDGGRSCWGVEEGGVRGYRREGGGGGGGDIESVHVKELWWARSVVLCRSLSTTLKEKYDELAANFHAEALEGFRKRGPLCMPEMQPV